MSWGIEYTATLFRVRKEELDYKIEDRISYLESLRQDLLILCTIDKHIIKADPERYDSVLDFIKDKFNEILKEIESTAVELHQMNCAKEDEDSVDA